MTPQQPQPDEIEKDFLFYVRDPLHAGSYISEIDPNYAVVKDWMANQRDLAVSRTDKTKDFNKAIADWQTNARQADALGLKRPPVPPIPSTEVDTLVEGADGKYAIHTEYQPVGSYPSPLLPDAPAVMPQQEGFGPGFGPAYQAHDDRIASLEARLAQLTALLAQALKLPTA